MWQFVLFSEIALRASQNEIVYAIRSASRKRDYMINVVLIPQFALAIVALASLSLVLLRNFSRGMTTVSLPCHGAATGGICTNVYRMSATPIPSVLVMFFAVITRPPSGLVSEFVRMRPVADAALFADLLFVRRIPRVLAIACKLRILPVLGVLFNSQVIAVSQSVLMTHLAIAIFASTRESAFSIIASIKFRQRLDFSALGATLSRGIHPAPHHAVSHSRCSQGSMSAAFSGINLDYIGDYNANERRKQ